MPKFNLYTIDHHPGGSEEYRCELGWARGEKVTLAVTRLADGADRTEEYLPPPSAITTPTVRTNTITVPASSTSTGTVTDTNSRWTRLFAPAGQQATISGADGVQELVPAWQGWRMALDRAQINTLIVELRRARDVTYGKDA
jgi:hypothetical protein